MLRSGLRWQWCAVLTALPCVLLQCETVTDGPALTVVTVGAQSSTASSGGMGGVPNSSSSSGGEGGVGPTSTSSSGVGGNGGTGGSPIVETPLNGCVKSMATDMSGMPAISLTNPLTAPYCLIVSEGATVDIDGTGSQGGPLILGGELKVGNVKAYDKSSPIQPSCYNCNSFPSCYDPNSASCYSSSSWTFVIKTAYPFYDNSDPVGRHGTIYVVD